MLLSVLFCANAYGDDVKVLFFEAAIARADATLSSEPTGFSELVDDLKSSGMLVASMSSGEITRKKLSSYEIVVMHPSPERPLEEREISALLWFVGKHGGALFVHGGDAEIVNPLTEIFGISMDGSNLIDISSAMEDSPDGRKFVLSRFPFTASADLASESVESIGFYGGAPLVITKDAAPVVTGDEDCYSDNGLYSIGSFPPVSATAFIGRGAILVKTDRTLFNNSNIDDYANRDWANLVFSRLAKVRSTGLEREQSMLRLRTQLALLHNKQRLWAEERNKMESDLTASLDKTRQLKREVEEADLKSKALAEELDRLSEDSDRLTGRLSRYENPNTLKMAALIGAIVLLMAFLVGFSLGRRSMRGRV